jgi:GNAT superfamily N-acetyltransferase
VLPVSVRPVRGRRDLRAFVKLPYRLHAADPLWAPPLRREIADRLSPSHPFFDHGSAEYFLARRGGEVVGRIAAASNRLHNETHEDRVGFFGFFECVDDPAVATALLDAAAEWARGRGHDMLRGPASLSVNDECGLLVDGFDTPPALLSPHNPPYYAALLETAGFHKAKDLLSYEGGSCFGPLPDRLSRAVKRLGERLRVTLRPIDTRDFEAEVERVRELYNAMWERNWGFVPMTAREIRHMARQLKPFVMPDLVPFAERDGRPIGFGLAVPDLNQPLLANRSGRLLPGALRILWALKRGKIHRARVLLLGVLPEYRGKGVDAMLWHWIWTRSERLGIDWGEAGWILEDNASMRNAALRSSFKHYKTYRLYERPL